MNLTVIRRVDAQDIAAGGAVGPAAAVAQPLSRQQQPAHSLYVLGGSLSVLQCGWTPACVILAVGGVVRVRRGRVLSEVEAGSALLLEEGAQFSLQCMGAAQGLCLMLNPAAIAAVGGAGVLGRRLPSRRFAAGDSLLQPLLELNRRCRRDAAEWMDDHGAVGAFLYQLRQHQSDAEQRLGRCPGRTLAHKRDVHARLARVAAMLDAPGGSPADLATLAELANYSPTHFLRLFAAVYGASPHDYQVQVRLQKAHRLVLESNLAVRDIAESVGFESRSTFNRLFRRAYGASAADLRSRPQRWSARGHARCESTAARAAAAGG